MPSNYHISAQEIMIARRLFLDGFEAKQSTVKKWLTTPRIHEAVRPIHKEGIPLKVIMVETVFERHVIQFAVVCMLWNIVRGPFILQRLVQTIKCIVKRVGLKRNCY